MTKMKQLQLRNPQQTIIGATMKIVFVMAAAASALMMTASQSHSRYLPVAPADRRYLPVGRANGRTPSRAQPPRRQTEPTALYQPPDVDAQDDTPATRPSDDNPQSYPPSFAPSQPERTSNSAPEQASSRRYSPVASGTSGKGQSRGQKTYLPPSYGGNSGSAGSGDASYDFEYRVEDAKSGNSFGHRESRRGEKVSGGYRVLLPDGRTQVVDYVADRGGYKPKVSYEGGVAAAAGAGGGYRYKRFNRFVN